jgi:glycosyltransferase involved in cell wall biosynthesis
MPVFNGVKYLPRVFSSLAAQTFKDYELIVIDDGSTDESARQAELLIARHDIRATVVRSTNRGAEQARDLGCLHARAGLIAQLDCDDWWQPTYLEEMLGTLQSQPEIDLLYCDLIEEFADGGRTLKSDAASWIDLSRAEQFGDLYKFPRGEFFAMLLGGQVLFPPCTVYRKEAYEKAGRYMGILPELPVSLDWGFGLRVSRVGTVGFLKRPLLHKFVHGGNVSRNLVKTIGCSVQVLETVLADRTLSPEELRIGRARGALICTWASYESWAVHRNHTQALRWALRSLKFRWSVSALKLAACSLIPRTLVERLRFVRSHARI